MSSYKRKRSKKPRTFVLNAWVEYCSPRQLKSNMPEDCILICSRYLIGTHTYIVLLMKKTDVHGSEVSLIVPYYLKYLAIGQGGQNVKRIAKLINASAVYVI